jgi:hypothetical protein
MIMALPSFAAGPHDDAFWERRQLRPRGWPNKHCSPAYYAPEGVHNPVPSWALPEVAARARFPVYWYHHLREWRNWQTRKT